MKIQYVKNTLRFILCIAIMLSFTACQQSIAESNVFSSIINEQSSTESIPVSVPPISSILPTDSSSTSELPAGLPPEINVREGYQIEDFGESGGATYTFLVYSFRHQEDDTLRYWEILVKQGNEIVDILQVENDEYGAAFPTAGKMALEIDANFDGANDVLICLGHFGTQGAVLYKCYLSVDNALVHCPSFSEILNPSLDAERQQVFSIWRNSAASHGQGRYIAENNQFVLAERYTQEAQTEQDAAEARIDWTIEAFENGEWVIKAEFAETDFSEEELQEKLYGESSLWANFEKAVPLWTYNYAD